MDKIHVIDDFLQDDELNKVNEIIKSKTWSYGHTSNGNRLNNDINFWNVKLDDEDIFSMEIKKIIEKTFSKKLNLLRVYANGQTFGQDGSYHIDNDSENHYTFVLYINKINKEDVDLAGGYIYFKLPDLKYKICFEPLNNRGIFFPSTYIHKAAAFTRFITDMRIAIAWKFEEL